MQSRRRRREREMAYSPWRPGWRSVVVFLIAAALAHVSGWGGPLLEEYLR